MNLSFLLSFVNITEINEDLYTIRYFPFNNTKLSTNELNYLIWNNFSSLFNDKSFITMDDLVYTVGLEKQSLINLFRLITSKDFIDYNIFSEFLNRVHKEDYLQLITNIPKDNLSTPSDWSSIGSDYESDDSIINIEENVKINIQETVENPISPQPKSLIKPKINPFDKASINKCVSPKITKSPQQRHNSLSPIPKSPVNNSSKNLSSPKTISPPKTISTQPNPVKFYDPNSIPKPKPQPKPKSRYHFCHFEYSSERQHSWYIECLLYVQHWFKTQKYIRVPDWVKKYF